MPKASSLGLNKDSWQSKMEKVTTHQRVEKKLFACQNLKFNTAVYNTAQAAELQTPDINDEGHDKQHKPKEIYTTFGCHPDSIKITL